MTRRGACVAAVVAAAAAAGILALSLGRDGEGGRAVPAPDAATREAIAADEGSGLAEPEPETSREREPQPSAAAPAGGARWTLRVVSGGTGRPIAGAEVVARAWDEGRLAGSAEAATDERGRADLVGLPRARGVFVSVSAEGWFPARGWVGRVLGEDVHEVRLVRARAVRGRVLDASTGMCIPGAETMDPSGTRGRADDGGGFDVLLPLVPEDELTFGAIAPGHCATWRTLDAADQRALARLELRTLPGARLEGRAVGEDGRPIAGVAMWATGHGERVPRPGTGPCSVSDGRRGARATTDEDGRFVLEGLAPTGLWRELVAGKGAWRVVGDTRFAVDEPGQELSMEVVLRRPGTVEGRVTCRGQPTRAVVAWRSDGGASGEVETGDAGRYRLAAVPAGVLWLEARPTRAADRYAGPTTRIEVVPGRTQRCDLGIPREIAVLSGRVLDPAGRPPPVATVEAHRRDRTGRAVASNHTDVAGAFRLELPLEPEGKWTLKAVAPGGERFVRGIEAPAEGIVLEVPASAQLALGVVDAQTGEPVERFALSWRRSGEDGWAHVRFGARTLPDGAELHHLPAGTLDLRLTPILEDHLEAVVEGVHLPAVGFGERSLELEVPLERAVGLALVFRSAEGAALPPAMEPRLEQLEGERGFEPTALRPKDDGRARAWTVPPGRYRLFDGARVATFEPETFDIGFERADEDGLQTVEIIVRE